VTAAITVGPWSVRVRRRPLLIGAVLLVVLAASIVAALSLGAYSVSPADVIATVFGGGSPAQQIIVGRLRLPRVLCAALVGVALGVAGGLFQSVSRNPLGSPDIIGFDTGASTGALVAILLLHGGILPTSIGALVGGAATAVLVYSLAFRGGVSPLRLVLVGLGGGALLGALNSLLIVRAELYDAQSATAWLIGNLAGRGWGNVALLAPVVAVGLVLAALLTRAMTIAEFPDDRAISLGAHPGRTRLAAVAVGVLLASGAVATAGPIQFVALAAPQIARRLTRAPGPNLLPAGLTGAVLLVLADLVAREAFQPRQYPVGVLTGLVGGGYLAWLLGREWREGRA
jgi:iron complex transport system permease protein